MTSKVLIFIPSSFMIRSISARCFLILSFLISGHLGDAKEYIQYRQTALFFKSDAEYGTRVAEGIGLDVARVKDLALMSQEERVEATREIK